MKIERIEEFRISQDIHHTIHELLAQSFQEYPAGRIYFKQIPDFRYLFWNDGQLIGHMAVEYRAINVMNSMVRIFGVADLCVSEAFQSQKIASTLLGELEALAQNSHVDFIVLIADQHNLYKNNGFQVVNNTCRWLIVSEEKTLGVGQRKINDSLLVKPIGKKKWQEGTVDFLGPMF